MNKKTVTCIHLCMQAYMSIDTYMHKCIYKICMSIFTHIHTYLYVYIHMQRHCFMMHISMFFFQLLAISRNMPFCYEMYTRYHTMQSIDHRH